MEEWFIRKSVKDIFSRTRSKINKEAIRVKKLEEKLKERDSLITEIVTENVSLKKVSLERFDISMGWFGYKGWSNRIYHEVDRHKNIHKNKA